MTKLQIAEGYKGLYGAIAQMVVKQSQITWDTTSNTVGR